MRLPIFKFPNSTMPSAVRCSLVAMASMASMWFLSPSGAPIFCQSAFGQPPADDPITVKITVGKPIDEVKSTSKSPFSGTRPAVDVAILLDTSNSMDGLISQAKSQLWNIVQQFAQAKRNGQTPLLRVSVFEYGNTQLPANEGFIRQVCQLTDDLDKVSESLFSLKTEGGDEYCGMVIAEAIKRLDWSGEPNAYKAIFIAGNEPFSQGSVDFHDSCRQAIQTGIVVNTIHCGDRQTGIGGHWEEGAQLAEGEFMNIDQDRQVVHIDCPQDKLIIELNTKLNATYLWYGENRRELGRNQTEQDFNAASASPSALIQRASVKGGEGYSNVGRDLIDSVRVDDELLTKVDRQLLPDELQAMSVAEQKAHIAKLAAEREAIQKELATANREREAFLVKEQKKLASETGEATLGDAVIAAVRKQLTKSGFDLTEQK